MIDTLLATVDRARARRRVAPVRPRRRAVRARDAPPAGARRRAGLLARDARRRSSGSPSACRSSSRCTRARARGSSELGARRRRACASSPPLGYRDFLSLELGAAAVLTDSGGVQEETTALGMPCFTLRENTERPVTVTHGTNTVLGLEPARIDEVPALLDEIVPTGPPPLWDGHAGERAAFAVESYLEVGAERVTTTALTHPLAVRARPTLQ